MPVLLITGPVGSGKTSVSDEVSRRLAAQGRAHGLVDLDALSQCWPRAADDRFNQSLGLRNLAAIWPNYRAQGARSLVLARVVESQADIAEVGRAVPGSVLTVVRLRAPAPVLEERVRRREQGSGQAWHLARAVQLAAEMDALGLGEHVVETAGRSIEEVAEEVLVRSGWDR